MDQQVTHKIKPVILNKDINKRFFLFLSILSHKLFSDIADIFILPVILTVYVNPL